MTLEEMQEQVERIYIDMENELLLNIAKKISAGKPMEIDKWDLEKGEPIYGSGGVNEWQLERLKELGGLTKENAEIIAKYSNKTKEEIEKIFERAKEIGTEVDKDILELGVKAGVLNEVNPILESAIVKKVLNNAIKETLTTFNKQNNSLLASAGDNYKEIVNKVSAQVLAGTKTTAKAMQEAVTELSKNGLTGFTAKNGARWSPEAYTKMVLRANTQNTINNIQEERMKASGGGYWEINQYAGARPKCSEDQGQIYSISGDTTPIEDGKGRKIEVRKWSDSTYGEPDGILGINCGHSRYMFVPGLSIFRSEPINKEENDEMYREKQQQRLYERTIRNKKREIRNLEEIGAEEDYIKIRRNQLSNYRKEYLSFLDKTGRTRVSANEWIVKNSNKLYSTTNDFNNAHINSIIKNAKQIISERFYKRTKGIKIIKHNEKYSYFSVERKSIILGTNADEFTLIHELGHKLYETFTKEEKKLYNNLIKTKFSEYQKQDFKLINSKTGKYWILKDNSKFISQYQTRIYFGGFKLNGKVKTSHALEYFSEGIKFYYKDPNKLKNIDKELFDFIRKVVDD